jgi:hypothetical protein
VAGLCASALGACRPLSGFGLLTYVWLISGVFRWPVFILFLDPRSTEAPLSVDRVPRSGRYVLRYLVSGISGIWYPVAMAGLVGPCWSISCHTGRGGGGAVGHTARYCRWSGHAAATASAYVVIATAIAFVRGIVGLLP